METDELVLLFTQKSPSGGRAKTTRTFRSGGEEEGLSTLRFPLALTAGQPQLDSAEIPPDLSKTRPGLGRDSLGLGQDWTGFGQYSARTRPGRSQSSLGL